MSEQSPNHILGEPDILMADRITEKGLYHAPIFGIRTRPLYEFCEAERVIEVQDTVWGRETIGGWLGDEIFFELYFNDLVKRSAGIEQLTLPREFTTIPDTADMSRWEHLWGSVVFARKMIADARERGIKIDDREALIYQLRTFMSDLGHTAFSHMGDFMFQGFGGTEDQHDLELEQLLEICGVSNILRQHNINPDEVNLEKVDIQDWVECKSPRLCIDRVDYGMREALRYLKPTDYPINSYPFNSDENSGLFQLVRASDETLQLVMKSHAAAKQFATSFALLPTEHWAQPVHRLALYDLARLVRSVVVSGDTSPTSAENLSDAHPRDAIYTVDREILARSQYFSPENFDMRRKLRDTACSQRQTFAQHPYGRAWQLEQFINDFMSAPAGQSAPHFPDPLVHYGEDIQGFPLIPDSIEMIETDDKLGAAKSRYARNVPLPALKPRAIDPDFINNQGEIVTLSEVDPHFRRLLSEQQVIQLRNYVARIFSSPAAVKDSKKREREINKEWIKQLERSRLTPDRLREVIRVAGNVAISQSNNIRYLAKLIGNLSLANRSS